jgi:hypothetical protein
LPAGIGEFGRFQEQLVDDLTSGSACFDGHGLIGNICRERFVERISTKHTFHF